MRRTSDLTEFLNAPENSVTRERLFFHRLCFDMYTAAAKRGYPLVVFSPEVDREGYDLVVDDGDNECRIQLKSRLVSSQTRIWKTWKRFLRPSLRDSGWFGFERSPEGVGLGGGVVIIEGNTRGDDFQITYHFTDLLILAALECGWIPGKAPARSQPRRRAPHNPGEQATDIIRQLRFGLGHERLHLPIGVFVKAKGIDELLALIGLHSSIHTNFRYRLHLRLGSKYNARTHGPLEHQILNDLATLVEHAGTVPET